MTIGSSLKQYKNFTLFLLLTAIVCFFVAELLGVLIANLYMDIKYYVGGGFLDIYGYTASHCIAILSVYFVPGTLSAVFKFNSYKYNYLNVLFAWIFLLFYWSAENIFPSWLFEGYESISYIAQLICVLIGFYAGSKFNVILAVKKNI